VADAQTLKVGRNDDADFNIEKVEKTIIGKLYHSFVYIFFTVTLY
jgi:hypothetical protein